MTSLALEGHQSTKVDIDLCAGCRGFWFDRYESLRLSPGATLQLFTLMAEPGSAGDPRPQMMRCPRCRARLAVTHDMQHSTRFQYWKCPQNHGHFITFLEFLREKDFIHALTPQQIAELRQNVQTVNCSNCGGPIDLAKESICPHCGSALSMLDMGQMKQMVAELKNAGQPRAVDPSLPLTLERIRLDADQHVAAIARASGPQSLVEAGLRLVVQWMKDS